MADREHREPTPANAIGKLGFGSARLLMRVDRKTAVALIHAALDAGISHHDVARSYGDGRTESIIGEVARARRSEMIIVTKAGLSPPDYVNRAYRKASRLMGRAREIPPRRSFRPDDIKRSIHQSLRSLKTDYIDALLLHECTLLDISDELKAVLLRAKQDGIVRKLGVATSVAEASAIVAAHPEIADIVQVEANSISLLGTPVSVEVITHSVSALPGSGPSELGWEQRLRNALLSNWNGAVLFSSARKEHIQQNVKIAHDLSTRPVERSRGRRPSGVNPG